MGFHHHHHHGPRFGRRGGGYRAPLIVGGGGRGGRGMGVVGCVLVIVFLLIFAAAITLIVIFASQPSQCPSNREPCPECASWMNQTYFNATSNSMSWYIQEICWEHLGWENLTLREQFLWTQLGQGQASWNNGKEVGAATKCWDDLSTTQEEVAEELGFRKSLWDCE